MPWSKKKKKKEKKRKEEEEDEEGENEEEKRPLTNCQSIFSFIHFLSQSFIGEGIRRRGYSLFIVADKFQMNKGLIQKFIQKDRKGLSQHNLKPRSPKRKERQL